MKLGCECFAKVKHMYNLVTYDSSALAYSKTNTFLSIWSGNYTICISIMNDVDYHDNVLNPAGI